MHTSYTATLTFTTRRDIEELADAVAPYHGALSQDSAGASATITFPAETAAQAAATALAIGQTLGAITGIEVITTAEHDRRHGEIPIPDLSSVEEAATALGISRQAVVKRIATGSLQAIRVGRAWVIPSSTLPNRHE